jgi:hypothetical protein
MEFFCGTDDNISFGPYQVGDDSVTSAIDSNNILIRICQMSVQKVTNSLARQLEF